MTTLPISLTILAYIDPATTTYIIQVLTALIITLGITLSIVVYRLQSILMNIRMFFYRFYTHTIKRQYAHDTPGGKTASDRGAADTGRPVYAYPKNVLPGDAIGASARRRIRAGRAPGGGAPGGGAPGGGAATTTATAAAASGATGASAIATDSASTAAAAKDTGQHHSEGSVGFLLDDGRPLRRRILIAALLSAGISMTFFVFSILDLIAANPDFLSYLLPDIIVPVLLAGLGVFVVLTLILLPFRGRLFDILATILLFLLIAGYLQGTFLNPNLGTLTGDAIPWHHLRTQTVLNLALWMALLAVVFAVRYFFRRFWSIMVLAVPSILIVAQLIALISLAPALSAGSLDAVEAAPPPPPSSGSPSSSDAASPRESDGTKIQELISTRGLTEVSPHKNIVVFLLDRLDDEYVEEVIADDPAFFNELDGFTRFTNNITHYRWTFPSITEMLTGYKYLTNDHQHEFFELAYGESTFLPSLKAEDYEVKIYSDHSIYDDPALLRPHIDNLEHFSLELETGTALKNLVILSAYRTAPLALKPTFWTSSSDFSGLYRPVEGPTQPYAIDDVRLMQTFKTQRLSADMPKNNFAFYHLMGPHTPIYMDENAEYAPADASSVLQQTKGSFKVVYEYLNQLRELGLYDDATILITADHGSSGAGAVDGGGMPWNGDPNVAALFVKPAGVHGSPMTLNNAPVSTENLRATIMEAAGLDPTPYGPTCFEVPESSNHVRQFYWLVDARGMDFRYQVFDVTGDARNVDNWTYVEDIYPNGEMIYTK
jgi:hypothetical protein